MWITRDSVAVYVVLIEIEAPAKPWATVRGQRSSKLTQAESQIKDWKVWSYRFWTRGIGLSALMDAAARDR